MTPNPTDGQTFVSQPCPTTSHRGAGVNHPVLVLVLHLLVVSERARSTSDHQSGDVLSEELMLHSEVVGVQLNNLTDLNRRQVALKAESIPPVSTRCSTSGLLGPASESTFCVLFNFGCRGNLKEQVYCEQGVTMKSLCDKLFQSDEAEHRRMRMKVRVLFGCFRRRQNHNPSLLLLPLPVTLALIKLPGLVR